ncbi:MAG: murein biosynthesis integral membrane protein MurJ [Cocleimonas sp.]|nr:murein biosynthesis integral membrane protein MurJ [Cocleimonas sp.]
MGKLLRSGAVISAMTMISRVLGLVRDLVFANYFLIGGISDAFFAAFRIPNLLRRLVAEGAFSLAFVPVLVEYKETRSKEALHDLLDHVAGMLGIILLVISIVGVIAAPIIMFIFTPGFDSKPDARPELAVDLLRITFPYIFFISLSALAGGILNTYKRFAVPAFTPVLLNVTLLISIIWISPYFDEPIKAVAWGVLIGGIVQLAFQIPALYKIGMIPKLKFKRSHQGVKHVMKLMVPALLGSSVAQINLLLNTLIASFLTVGSMSWLYYSDRFVELPLAIIGVAIGTVILPKLSGDHANKDPEKFSSTLDSAIRIALMIGIPAMVGLIMLAKPIMAFALDNGVNGWHDVEMSSMSLMTYALGLPAFILVKVLAPGFYSRQDTKTPVRIGIISVLSNIVLSALIVYPWYKLGYIGPHAGLAFAVAMAGYINAGMLYYQLKKQGIYFHQKGSASQKESARLWVRDLFRIGVALIVMAAVLWWLTPADSWWQGATMWTKVGHLLALVVLAVMAYFGALFLLGVRKQHIV